MGKTWIILSFSLKNRKSTNNIYLFIYFYTHRLIYNIYKYGVVKLNSGHKSVKSRVYINFRESDESGFYYHSQDIKLTENCKKGLC